MDKACDIYGFAMCQALKYEYASGQTVAVKTEQHMAQNYLVDGFMEWQDDWLDNTDSAAILVQNIGLSGVPLSFFVATDDNTCP